MDTKRLLKNLERAAKRAIPRGWRMTAKASANLARAYGHHRSAALGRAVDRQGRPLPWYTYPAIEYLSQFDWADADLFEYGSGQSTLFWAARCRAILAVEDDAGWHARVTAQMPGNVDYRLVTDRAAYVAALGQSGRQFDVIVIDGTARTECAAGAAAHLKPGGVILLDNSDWFPGAAAHLRAADLIQVDMHGFGPVNPYTWTTSLFLHRAFRRAARSGRQPDYSGAAVRVVNDGR